MAIHEKLQTITETTNRRNWRGTTGAVALTALVATACTSQSQHTAPSPAPRPSTHNRIAWLPDTTRIDAAAKSIVIAALHGYNEVKAQPCTEVDTTQNSVGSCHDRTLIPGKRLGLGYSKELFNGSITATSEHATSEVDVLATRTPSEGIVLDVSFDASDDNFDAPESTASAATLRFVNRSATSLPTNLAALESFTNNTNTQLTQLAFSNKGRTAIDVKESIKPAGVTVRPSSNRFPSGPGLTVELALVALNATDAMSSIHVD